MIRKNLGKRWMIGVMMNLLRKRNSRGVGVLKKMMMMMKVLMRIVRSVALLCVWAELMSSLPRVERRLLALNQNQNLVASPRPNLNRKAVHRSPNLNPDHRH